MPTTEERLKILNMVQQGKLSPDGAAQLLEALEDPLPESKGGKKTGEETNQPADGSVIQPRWVRVKVTHTGSPKPYVNLRLPVSLVKAGLKMGQYFSPEIEGVMPEDIFGLIQNGELGQIADVNDETDGEHVEIYLE
jgi:hypothetical protein